MRDYNHSAEVMCLFLFLSFVSQKLKMYFLILVYRLSLSVSLCLSFPSFLFDCYRLFLTFQPCGWRRGPT